MMTTTELHLTRTCLYCAKPLPDTALSSRLYCGERCRRLYQDQRRRMERAQARALRNPSNRTMADPWSRPELWNDERTLALSMLDALPART